MYESLEGTWSGWGRSIGLPGATPTRRHVGDVAFLATALGMPWLRVLRGRAGVVDAVLLALRFGTLVGTRRAYARHGWGYWLSPLADTVAVVAVAVSGARRRQSWRGRSYAR